MKSCRLAWESVIVIDLTDRPALRGITIAADALGIVQPIYRNDSGLAEALHRSTLLRAARRAEIRGRRYVTRARA
jgi:hypothetical protein